MLRAPSGTRTHTITVFKTADSTIGLQERDPTEN